MLPLEGIKVVEIAQNLAGPHCGQILGALGAEVIKIERPGGGDDARAWGPPFDKGMGAGFHAVNQNKLSVTCDMTCAEDMQRLLDLIATSDVLVHNMRPGVMEGASLDAETLTARFPRLIYGAISGFGAAGPLRERPGYDAVVQALAGFFYLNGGQEDPPTRIGPTVLDMGTGVWMALGILAKLRQRDATGKGGVVEASLLETALGYISPLTAVTSLTGKSPTRVRSGTALVVPFETFPTQDGDIIVAGANDRLFGKFADVLGHPEWRQDAKYATNADRQANKAELVEKIAAIMKTQPNAYWLERLEAQAIPCSQINTLPQALEHPQMQALGILDTDPDSGLLLTKMPFSLDGARPLTRSQAPALGEHNQDVAPFDAASQGQIDRA